GEGGGAPLVPLAQLNEVPDLSRGEAPLRAAVVARDQRDAWNRFPEGRLGSVWIYKDEKDGREGREDDRLTCLSTVCPHAGCAVDYDEQRRAFACPCHRSSFSLDGRRLSGPSPRDM